MFLITGSQGQLGNELRALLGTRAEYVDRDRLDITDMAAVEAFCKNDRFEAIVNCAAWTAVDAAEQNAAEAWKVNADGPKNLAATGIPVIQISTDYVFPGTACRPYAENDATGPRSVYGKTKRAGEEAVWSGAAACVILRTSWLYSSFGGNFVKTMRRLGRERDEISVVCDQIGSPTYARDLAEAVVLALGHLKPGVRELYHFSNEGVCSWYDFALAVMEMSNIACHVRPIMTSEYPSAAERPPYSVLDKKLWKHAFCRAVPHWRVSLRRCLEQLDAAEHQSTEICRS